MALENSELLIWLDKVKVADTLQAERAARDQGHWDKMLEFWHPQSLVDISWFRGNGPDFVAASQEMYEAGVHSLHHMAPTVATVQGNRALAETGCTIILHGRVGGIAAFMTSYSRLFSRLIRLETTWKLCGFRIVYDFDFLTPLNPSHRLVVDEERLKEYRASYRYAAYLWAENGKMPNPLLAGSDKPESVQALQQAELLWLGGNG